MYSALYAAIDQGKLNIMTEITVKELPGKHLAGMVVRTNMQKASTDCPALWLAFGPRICTIPGCVGIGETYGLSVMISQDGTFDYWAAVETPPDVTLPEGIPTVEMPAGLYAVAFSPNLERIAAILTEIYMEWPQRQSEYAVDMQAPCVEVYRGNWTPDDPIEVWVPVIKKA